MRSRLHVVGAGVAGLSAALEATRRGVSTHLYEAAPQAGGRCRTIETADGFVHDNGTHVLVAANRQAMAFLDAVGARAHWVEPEPAGLPLVDLRSGQVSWVGLSPWSWRDRRLRPPGLAARDLLRMLHLAGPGRDRPVAEIMGRSRTLESFIEPLTVAVLNTPVRVASSRRLGQVLRRLAVPGAARLLIARQGLGPNLVDPAIRVLRDRGVELSFGSRLRGIVQQDGRATALTFADRAHPLGGKDYVVLAVPPWEVERLLPGTPVPTAFEAIVNVHYRCARDIPLRFFGLLGGSAQWVLARPGQISVTISAGNDVVGEGTADLARDIWREVRAGLQALGFGADEVDPPSRVVKERRATIRQEAGLVVGTPRRPLDNLVLAGDWLSPFPATIESAAKSGLDAVRTFDRDGVRWERPGPSREADAAHEGAS